jgi:hypothetical protein
MKKLTLLMKNFDTKPEPIKIPPGTYSAAKFAKLYPMEYKRLVRAGMPHAVNSLITIR